MRGLMHLLKGGAPEPSPDDAGSQLLLILIAPESSAKYPAVAVSSHSEEADKPFRFVLVCSSGTNGFPQLV